MGRFHVMRAWLILFGSIAGAVFVLRALAGEPHGTIDVSRALDASAAPWTAADVNIASIAIDPQPLVERDQWVFDLRWDRGEVWLLGVHPLRLPAPQITPRAMGRFALELFEGRTLLERVRFDFPLLGVSEADAAVSLTKKLSTRIGVVFPATKRGTRLELWDRETNRRWSLPWPLRPPSEVPHARAKRESGPHNDDAGER
jgi:hypothetical protein